jgi:hypothetical protein
MSHTDLANVWEKPQSFRGQDHYGLRLNNLTTAQRDALTGSGAPFAGAAIFNTTTGQPEFYDGSNWVSHFAVDNVSVAGEITVDGATGTGADTAGVLRLETAETTVVAQDQLGRIDFRAPAETGADAILVSASMWAEATATFSATVNTTDFVWALGTSEVAAEKMRLTPAGVLTVQSGGQFPTANQAVVAGSDGFVPSRIHIIADGAAVVLSSADSGGLIVMDKTDGSLTTLPEITASNIGMTFEFQWPASWASGDQKIITGNAADFIVGTILMFDTDTLTDPLSVITFNGSSHIAVLINAATDGGLLGSWLRFTAISATQWLIQGVLHHSGGVSSPVSTT